MKTLNVGQALAARARLGRAKRWVIKIGSALVTNNGLGLNGALIESWAAQIAALKAADKEIVIVSSGAVAEGAARLGWTTRPHSLHQLQAAAAIGQMGLVRCWELAFQAFEIQAAQVLLTHEDLSDRQRYLNARSTLWTLLKLGVCPIVNENDTVATEEIRLGDNDTLAGLVSNLIDADVLVILTDQPGLMSADPRQEANAELIRAADVQEPALDLAAGPGGEWGRGGMHTKLAAARLAARSGTSTLICAGAREQILASIAKGEDVGTLLLASEEKIAARKQWLAGPIQPKGEIHLDEGASRVIRQHGRSLLCVGVTGFRGEFKRGELVSCFDPGGNEIARGLTNYSHDELVVIKGLNSEKIEAALGFAREPELIHRDNLVVF